MATRVSIVVNDEIKAKIIHAYAPHERENKGEYIEFFAKRCDLVVTVYTSKKNTTGYKVVFIGDNALEEAQRFDKDATINVPKAKINAHWLSNEDQIGSDEVGTGDFFGPICVCAAYVKSFQIPMLKKLGVDDSKKLSDSQIKELGSKLVKEIPYSQVSLDNEKYNELVKKDMNMNEMKVKLHNQVLLNLKKKFPEVKNFFIDEFTPKENYYEYLKDKEEIVSDLNFKTKGESYFPSVAVGSIIARYSFLLKMEQLGKKYDMVFPHGSSLKVDSFASEFIKKYGFSELKKVCKTNFINYKKLL